MNFYSEILRIFPEIEQIFPRMNLWNNLEEFFQRNSVVSMPQNLRDNHQIFVHTEDMNFPSLIYPVLLKTALSKSCMVKSATSSWYMDVIPSMNIEKTEPKSKRFMLNAGPPAPVVVDVDTVVAVVVGAME